MKILSKLTTFIAKRSNTTLGENLFGHIERFIGKRSSHGVTELKPCIRGSKRVPNSVFQNEIITDSETISQVENLCNKMGVYYAQKFSITTRHLTKIKYKKAKTIEEAKEYAEKVLGIQNFDIPDLEVANQINLSMTNAIKKSKGKIQLPNKVEFASITSDCGKYSPIEAPAETLWCKETNEMTLRINKDYYNNIDNKIKSYIDRFEKNGQLSTNSKGRDCIDLISSYKYNTTLNRYYRLWKQGKLTPKAKLDFDNLLMKAREKEQAVLYEKDSMIDYVKKSLGIDLSNLPKEEYIEKATQALLKLRKEQKILLGTDYYQTKNAIGLDSHVLHELGHVTHLKKINFDDFTSEVLAKFENPLEFETALRISPYATESKGEMIAEYIKGILSGDKYTDDINRLFEECFKGRFSSTTSNRFVKLG